MPDPAPFSFLEAIAWARARRVELPETYYSELQGLARAMAFSIAGLAKLDQIQAVMDSLAEATANGEPFQSWAKRATDPQGGIRLDLPAHRIENLFRTNLQNHFARGRCEQQKRAVDRFPYLLYDAVNDSRTRPSHAALDGMIARHDDPRWNTLRVPNGFQCRCRILALSERQAPRFIAADAKRMQDPEYAQARANAKPDKGWDYDLCAEPTEGLRRAIENKRARVDPRLMAAFDDDPDGLLRAWPVRGLARRFPARDLATLAVLLREYANRLPGDLPHGVTFVREGGPGDDFYMATDGKGGFWFRDIAYQGFHSRRDLFGGLAACAERRAMSREEEYALESLWHEIWHNRQTGAQAALDLDLEHPLRRFTETLNQAVARLTYPTFIERLGGTVSHQHWVIESGYGYQKTVSRLWDVIRSCGLSPLEMAGDLATVNLTGDLMQARAQLAVLLARRTGVKKAAIQAALELLTAREAVFRSALSDLKS